MRNIRSIIASMLLLASLVTAAFGNAVVGGSGRAEFSRLKWRGEVVRISISSSMTRPGPNIKSDSDVLGALRRSVQAWSDVADVDIQTDLTDKQSVSPAGVAGDGVSLITIAQSPENVLFFTSDADTVSAKTRIFYNRKGFITEADIVLNPFQQFSTDGTFGTFDLESTLTHEIGHLLGLRHSAVISATMAENLARNGTRGLIDLSPRTLADSDIAAIRDLYGARAGNEECCAAVSGKLSVIGGKGQSQIRIWAEETESGRVVSQTEAAADGSYRLGGMPAGEYTLYWKSHEQTPQSAYGTFGNVQLDIAEGKTLNARISLKASDVDLQYLGLNGRLADFSLPVAGGRSYTLNLGGKNLTEGHIEFRTPFISALSLPAVTQEFSDGIFGLTYFVSVEREIPAGQYTIDLVDQNGERTCMIGGLNVE
jgi:hypothetical protein